MVEISLVTSSSVVYEPRIDKVVRSLAKKYSLSVIGWNRDGITRKEINDYLVELNLFYLRTPFWKPSLLRILVRLIAFLSLFWIWVFIRLIVSRPEVIHACDLDTLFPCYLYKVLFRKKIVFDVIDRYAMIYVPTRFKRLYSIVTSLEEHFAKHSDVLIVAGGQKVFDTFKKRPKFSYVVMNCSAYSANVSRVRQNRKNEEFTLVYTGLIRHSRSLGSVAAAVKKMKGTQLLLVGAIYDNDVYKDLMEIGNVKYLGKLRPNDALELEASADVMIALYDLEHPQNVVVIPNKILEAMMCGIPVITNAAEELVRDIECGLLVEYDNVDQISEAIKKLKEDSDLRTRLGNNGHKAYVEKYNWNRMEDKLYKIYDNLLKK
jgi:glycosyltransferase involved in cell wall biosynthesis